MSHHTMFMDNWDELRTEGRPGLAGLTGVRSSSQKFRAVTGDGVVIGHLARCGLDKPPGFPLKDAMVKIASAKRPNDSSARQRPGRSQTSVAARLDHLWKEFRSVGDAIEATAADGKPVAALLRKQEKLRARSWALAAQGESEGLALAERAVGGALRQGRKPKAVAGDF